MKRLLTIGHSYVVGMNRKLAHEMAVAGQGRWAVTAVAPIEFPGDLRPIELESIAGERSHVVPLDMRWARAPHLMTYKGLAPLMSQQWDVIHCWEEPYVAACAQAAFFASRQARFVFGTFQNIAKRYPVPLSLFERRVLRRANGWIAFGRTAHETQRARRAEYQALPSRMITPGVDLQAFSRPSAAQRAAARAVLGWHDDVPVVGFVGRLVPEKGIKTLLEALDTLHGPWRALFVGDGPERGTVDRFAAAHPGRVWIVNATHRDVPSRLSAMDVLCAPSQTTASWREQFGRMLVEAMASGLPVIASTSGEIPHVVGDAGVLLPESDVEAWHAAIERVLTDSAAKEDYARRGRERAEQHYGWSAIARQHLAFFEELTA